MPSRSVAETLDASGVARNRKAHRATPTIHPELDPLDPATLRWATSNTFLAVQGTVVGAPASLQSLIESGVLSRVTVEPGAVTTTLADGHSWDHAGPRVRTALLSALREPDGWLTDGDNSGSALLKAACLSVFEGPVGDFVRSHGGSVTLVSCTDVTATVDLGGQCAGCSASGVTLTHRVESAVRAVYPPLLRIELAATCGDTPRRSWLSLLRK